MVITYEIAISDIISIVLSVVSLILAVCGGIFVFVQWRNTTLLKRADYVNELTEKIRTDSYISEVLSLLDHQEHVWYTPVFHYGGEMKKRLIEHCRFFHMFAT